MVEVQEHSAEQKIKEAAEALFAELGMKGTTIRKVAERADVNIALVNYYFRSKEKLFQSIFEEKFKTYMDIGLGILTDRSRDLWIRLEDYINEMVSNMKKDEHLPIFIMSETHYDPDLILGMRSFSKEEMQIKAERIQDMLDSEYQKGNIRKVFALDFELTMSSMLVFPFLTKNIVKHSGRLDDEFGSFDEYLDHVKGTVLFAMKQFLKTE